LLSQPELNLTAPSGVEIGFKLFSQTFNPHIKMSALDPSVVCPGVQDYIDEMFANNNPELLQEDNGAIMALMSPENTSDVVVERLVTAGGAITSQVSVVVSPRVDGSTGFEDTVPKCPPENADEPQPVEAYTYTLDDGLSRRFVMDKEAWRVICRGDNPSAQLAKYIVQYMNAATQRMNQKLVASIAANFGNYYGGTSSSSSPAALDLLQGTPESLNPGGYYDMVNAMSDIGANRFFLIGAGELRKALQFVGIGCCNTGGADLSQLEPGLFYLDKFARTTFTGERFAAVQPGSIIVPNFGMNVGEYAEDTGFEVKTTYQHPQTGLIFDFHIKRDVGCGDVYVWISKRYTTIYTRTNVFATGDPMFGVNGVVQFNAAT